MCGGKAWELGPSHCLSLSVKSQSDPAVRDGDVFYQKGLSPDLGS